MSDMSNRELRLIQRRLGNIGSHLPHMVDIEWKLDVVTNSSTTEGDGKMQYSIKFKTECGDRKDVQFTCDVHQLQDLIFKLKDIIRHCDKLKSGGL